MIRFAFAFAILFVAALPLCAQPPSYAKQIRPLIGKYCLECHNAKEMKGTLSLETHKAMMEGGDGGAVIVAGNPDKSKLVLQCEGKEKPTMPPPKAKFHPTKAEIALLRAWVTAGAKDDGADVKVVLPAIKPKVDVLPPVIGVGYFPKFQQLLIANGDFLTIIDDFPDGPALKYRPRGGRITALAVSAGGDIFVGTSIGQAARVFSADPGPLMDGSHKDSILDLAVDSKSRRLASAGYDAKVLVLDRQSIVAKTQELKEHSDAVYGLAFSPDGTLLASVSADRAMKVFDVEKGKLLYTLGHANDWLYAVAWSPDGKYLVSGGVDKSIRVYEALTPNPSPKGRGEWMGGAKLRQSVFAHEGAVLKLVFTSDSRTLYSVGEDRVVKAWDIEKMVERKVYDKQPETVLCLALREDAGQFIVGRYDGIVQLIDMKTGKVAHEFGNEKKPAKPRDERSDSRGQQPEKPPPSSWGVKTGVLDRAGAVHAYRLDAKKGEQLGMQITTEGKSKFEPMLTLTDASGRVIAESSDGLLGITFPENGNYALSVRDREYRGGADFKYQLKCGQVPIVTAVFPMGLQRGTKGDMQLDGVFLPKNVLSMTIPTDAKIGQMIPLTIGNSVLGKAQIIAGEFPEVTQVGKMPVPGTANGRLLRDNQKDLWAFTARKGQRLIVEVNARRLGSRLDSIIEILDKDDQPVPRAVLRSQAKTQVTFRDHDSAQGNIRIEAWSELATNDYLYVGNELMRIKELPTHPDADCNFFATEGRRLTYLDTTPTHHANNTPMYKVSLHPPGTKFPANGYPVFTLYYKNDDGGPGYGRDSRIVFDPPADGEYKVRIADARGMGGVNFGYRLTVREPRESFILRATKAPAVSTGGAIPITITAERIDGFDGPIKVSVKNLPAGFHMPATTIEAGTYSTTVALYAEANARLADKSVTFEGSTSATGMPFVFIGTLDLPKLIAPGDIVTTTAESAVSFVPGEQTKLTVMIERRNGFKGRVPLEVKGLPHGVRVLDIGLNGILVNENETTRTIVIYAEPWVQAAERPFVVLARREGKNTEHAAKSVLLKVKFAGP
jgi:WD40 repeat protein